MEAHIKSHSDSAAPVSPVTTPNESSCSSSSDKENKDTYTNLVVNTEPPVMSYDSDYRYYIYSRERLSPASLSYYHAANPTSGVELLAAAASVSDRAYEDFKPCSDTVLNLISRSSEVVAALRRPAYFSQTMHDAPITAGDDIRRRVEAALAVEEIPEEHILTPPSSNPVSPAPSSPDPELSLPPRKRSKMILKSMETTKDLSPVRYSSVIQYARAS